MFAAFIELLTPDPCSMSVVKDEGGNSSPSTNTEIDYESAPAPVLTLKAHGSGTGESVSLDWTGYDENGQGDVSFYRVYASDHTYTSVSAMTPSAAISFGAFTATIGKLVKGTTYYFAVVAVDTRGNALSEVSPVPATPTDTIPPEGATSFHVIKCFRDRLILGWSPSANTAKDLSGYRIYFDGAQTGAAIDPSLSTFEQGGLNSNTRE